MGNNFASTDFLDVDNDDMHHQPQQRRQKQRHRGARSFYYGSQTSTALDTNDLETMGKIRDRKNVISVTTGTVKRSSRRCPSFDSCCFSAMENDGENGGGDSQQRTLTLSLPMRMKRSSPRSAAAEDSYMRPIKILLLGTTESGKSTIFKYLSHVIYPSTATTNNSNSYNNKNNSITTKNESFTTNNGSSSSSHTNDCNHQKLTDEDNIDVGITVMDSWTKLKLVMNCVQFLKGILLVYPIQHFEHESSELLWQMLKQLSSVVTFSEISSLLHNSPSFVQDLQKLWMKEDAFRENCLNAVSECHLIRPYTAPFLLSHISELYYDQQHKVSSNMKLKAFLALNSPTSGIIESSLTHPLLPKQRTIQFVDVGGSRHERRKWTNLFDQTSAIFYCVSLSGFNEHLSDDDFYNNGSGDNSNSDKIAESLELFNEIANHSKFQPDTRIVLIFTHKDRFIRQLLRTDLKEAFPNLPKHLRYSQNAGRPMTVESSTPTVASPIQNNYNSYSNSSSYSVPSPNRLLSLNNNSNGNNGHNGAVPTNFDHMFDRIVCKTGTFKVLLEEGYRDIIYHICSFLNARQLVKLSYVNYTCYQIAGSDIVWSRLCQTFQPALDKREVEQIYLKRYVQQSKDNTMNVATTSSCCSCNEEQQQQRRSFGKNKYKFYFELGGGTFLHNIRFVVHEFLMRIQDERMREDTRTNGIMITNCLDTRFTRKKLASVVDKIVRSSSSSSPDHTMTK